MQSYAQDIFLKKSKTSKWGRTCCDFCHKYKPDIFPAKCYYINLLDTMCLSEFDFSCYTIEEFKNLKDTIYYTLINDSNIIKYLDKKYLK